MKKKGTGRTGAQAIESRLIKVLSRLKVPGKVTVQDIKDIIWNERDPHLSSRLIFALLEESNVADKDSHEVTDVIMEAWNFYPHESLNGLSPNEMMERATGNVNDKSKGELSERRDFYDVFAEQFPKETKVVNVGEHKWQFEFPTAIQRLRGMWEDLNESDDFDDEEEGEDDNFPGGDEFDGMSPYFFDGVVDFARELFEENGEYKKARVLLERSIAAGRMLLPPSFAVGKDRLPWGYLDNRPYLRLLAEYAQLVESMDGPSRAVPLYEELIALNPNDNQGIRSLLATAYIKTNQLEKLCELTKGYPDDLMPELMMGNILVLIKLDRLDEAKVAIKENAKHCKHLYKEILKTEHTQPELTEGRVTVGGDDEAWLYWDAQGTYWMSTPGAREFLRKVIG